jgi:hypothetical protein
MLDVMREEVLPALKRYPANQLTGSGMARQGGIMKRLKTFGLAAAMALALSAFLGGASASAALFHSASEETTWTGTGASGGVKHTIALSIDAIKCEETSFIGTSYTADTQEITVTPQLNKCGLVPTLPKVNWAMNGCQFRFHAGEGGDEEGVWSMGGTTMDIVNCVKPMTFTSPGCTLEIGNQSNVKSVSWSGTSVLSASTPLSGITYTRKSSGGCNSSLNGTFSDGSYEGSWTVKGSTGGTPTSLSVVPSNFNASAGPAIVTGKRASGIKAVFWTPITGVASCGSHTLTGEFGLSSQALTAAYSECLAGGLPLPFSMGGCSYVMHISGKLDIVGETCASKPITISYPSWCTLTIGPQNGLTGLTYSVKGSGSSRSVTQAGEAVGLKYTITGCEYAGTYTNGTYRASDSFTAATKAGGALGFWAE